MKKILFLIFFLSHKIIFAQNVYIDGTVLGLVEYQLRQQPRYNNNNLPVEVGAQYIFKNSRIGIDINMMTFLGGLPPPGDGTTYFDFSNSDYCTYSIIKKPGNVLLQFKGGLFYSHFITYYKPFNDVGPALGLDLVIPFSKRGYIGFDLSEMIGTNNNYDANIYDSYIYNTRRSTQISYTCYLVKFIGRL